VPFYLLPSLILRIPAMNAEIPCSWSQGIHTRSAQLAGATSLATRPQKVISSKFPVIFPVGRETRRRDGFAADYFLRHFRSELRTPGVAGSAHSRLRRHAIEMISSS
jgi:hypothetical protein